MKCPLCKNDAKHESVRGADQRGYFWCRCCDLIFVDPACRVDAAAERHRYAQHNNGPDQPGHVAFLSRTLNPLVARLTPGMRGLDFGCGPVPTLSVMLRRAGFTCDDYDPYFFPRDLAGPYDFITATEVVEHLFSPGDEIRKLCALLSPGGLLAIMTEHWTTIAEFSGWFYTRDETHVAFYHRRTIAYICRQFRFEEVYHDGRRVALLRQLGEGCANNSKNVP